MMGSGQHKTHGTPVKTAEIEPGSKFRRLHTSAGLFDDIFKRVIEMGRNMSVVLYIVVMIAVVVSGDVLFFKNRFFERLIANIGIVLVFLAFYLRFLKNP